MKNHLLSTGARRAVATLAWLLAVAACGEQGADRNAQTSDEEEAPSSSTTVTADTPAHKPNATDKLPVNAPSRGIEDALAEMDEGCDRILAERTITQCRVCHSVSEGQPNMTGPNLYGVYERQAAMVSGFAYSPTLRDAGLTWDEDTLNQFLENPQTYLPGNRMAFGGVRDAEARSALVCLLKALK